MKLPPRLFFTENFILAIPGLTGKERSSVYPEQLLRSTNARLYRFQFFEFFLFSFFTVKTFSIVPDLTVFVKF